MPTTTTLGELSLSAFMSSKICHDLVNPIGAINNGLELLEEEEDEETRAYAMELIQNSARAAVARLEFARLAFGASSGLGGTIDLNYAGSIARAFVEEGRHRLTWPASGGTWPKDRVRLLLMVLHISLLAVPGGGDVAVSVSGPRFDIRCKGRTARIPEKVSEIFAGQMLEPIEPRTVVPYYAARLAEELGLKLTVRRAEADILFTAEPRR